eukprot:204541-Chlamydomonas_euryale.AAC.2
MRAHSRAAASPPPLPPRPALTSARNTLPPPQNKAATGTQPSRQRQENAHTWCCMPVHTRHASRQHVARTEPARPPQPPLSASRLSAHSKD